MDNGLIYGETDWMVEWAKDHGPIFPRADVTAIGWGTDTDLRAVVLYDNFSACDCGIHIASDGTRKWMSRQFLYATFAHPFIQWGLRRVTGLVASRNTDALRFDKHIGFEVEGVVRHALPDDDIIMLGMLRENCRWIPEHARSAHHGR